ncbi:type VI secretion system contractile sheath small subunit [Serratia sp. DD3]|uniref:type VI secretion system contractile sheath small subunit n=1 Tax=Serratia sp. DD3 TaxID=1410619 RepID=UPI0003C4EBFE|nr:type VI secretion system contractile sheath small subunit [Serratia sp. DD3]KEY58754.1 type VI secretion protein, family [Serratia sp. DD3]
MANMKSRSGQKFIARNRAPRVQIEYDVEIYGAERKIQLPFVMGVMADLVGTPLEPQVGLEERKFLDIDIDNFDDRMKSLKPRVAFQVENTLSDEDLLNVELVFESMDDFSPAEIARKIEPLRHLLDARTQLSNLLSYMDGKSGAEELITKVLSNPGLLQSLTQAPMKETHGDPETATVPEE